MAAGSPNTGLNTSLDIIGNAVETIHDHHLWMYMSSMYPPCLMGHSHSHSNLSVKFTITFYSSRFSRNFFRSTPITFGTYLRREYPSSISTCLCHFSLLFHLKCKTKVHECHHMSVGVADEITGNLSYPKLLSLTRATLRVEKNTHLPAVGVSSGGVGTGRCREWIGTNPWHIPHIFRTPDPTICICVILVGDLLVRTVLSNVASIPFTPRPTERALGSIQPLIVWHTL